MEPERKPKEGWTQQDFKTFYLSPTIKCTFIMIAIVTFISFVFTVTLLSLSGQIVEVKERYDSVEEYSIGNTFNVSFNIGEKIEGPVYLYYQLTNFYQNHRKYVKSYSKSQLKGESVSEDDIKSSCDPIVYNEDLDPGRNAVDGSALNDNSIADPCGLIANSYFEDSYQLIKDGNQITIDDSDIAWSTDDKSKYGNSEDWEANQWTDKTDPHFKVWMRTAPSSTFRKLWGKIDQDLEPGDYTLKVNAKTDVSDWEGEKWVVLSNTNSFGGKNGVLGWSFFVSTLIGIGWMVAIFVLKKMNPYPTLEQKFVEYT